MLQLSVAGLRLTKIHPPSLIIRMDASASEPTFQSSRETRPPILTTKGLTVVITGIVFIVALLKADKKDIPLIVKTIVGSDSFSLAGWVLAGAFLLCGAVVITLMHGIYSKEIARLANERDKLQNKLIGGGAHD